MVYLQTFPGNDSIYWRGEANALSQRPFQQVSFPSYTPLPKIHTPFTPLFHQEKATANYHFSNYTSNIYLHFCVSPFHCNVSWTSEMQFYWNISKHGVAHNPMLHSRHLYFVLVSLFFAEHTWHWILWHCISQHLLCLVSSLFSRLIYRACFPCLVVWGRGTLPASCIRSLTSVSMNCQCDNFEPQEAWMIKLLTIVMPRGWKNSFFVHFQVHLLIE